MHLGLDQTGNPTCVSFTCFPLGKIKYLALDEHIKEVIIGISVVSVGHEVAEHSLVAALIEPEARQAPTCHRLL